MRSYKLKIFVGLMAVAFIFVMLPSISLSADEVTNGKCGDNLTWTYAKGTLTISGSGNMDDYQTIYTAPWNHLRSRMISVNFTGNVTSIGTNAFYGCSLLENLVLPDSMTSIGWQAFCGCKALRDFDMPSSVTEIKKGAFSGCSSLTNFVVPNGVTTINFLGSCTNLVSVTIPQSVTSIDENAFYNCSSLKEITIPDSVNSIGNSAFCYCSSLENLTIPNSVISIGSTAFSNSGIKSIVIPSSITTIERGTFFRCKNLESISLPEGLSSIETQAFCQCSSLNNIVLPNSLKTLGESAFSECINLSSVSLSTSLTSIGSSAFWGCKNIKKVIIPDSVSSIGDDAFKNCSSLTFVLLNKQADRVEAFPGIPAHVFHYYFDVSYTNDENGSVSGKKRSFVDDVIELTLTPNSGYEIESVTMTNNGQTVAIIPNENDKYICSMPDSDTGIEINATFRKAIKYKITVRETTAGTVKSSKTSAAKGEEVILTVKPATGYEFSYISVNSKRIYDTKFTMPAEDVTITVYFDLSVYKVYTANVINGKLSASPLAAHYNAAIMVKAIPDIGYDLDAIKVNGKKISKDYFYMPAEDVTVDAIFVPHNLKTIARKQPTCDRDGYEEYYKCERCNKLFSDSEGKHEITEPIVINKLGHKLETISEKAPTKTEEGNIKYYKCERCGKLFSDADGKNEIQLSDTFIPVMEHYLVHVEAKSATCTEDGNKEYYECRDNECQITNGGCHKKYSDKFGQNEIQDNDVVIHSVGHEILKVDAETPTCIKDGHEEYYECSRCHEKYSDAEGKNVISSPTVIEKLGHDWKEEGDVTKNPTCEEEGEMTFHCKRDGCSATKTVEIDAKGHDKENLIHHEAVSPTNYDDGSREYYECPDCHKKFKDSDCKETYTDAAIIIPAVGAAVLDEEAEYGDFKYRVTNPATNGTGTVVLIGVINETAIVSIPTSVEIKLNTYKVTRIGPKAFYGNKTIKSLHFGSNVTAIDSYAFQKCSNLTKVSGGSKVQTIGSYAFANCSKLSSFTITSSGLKKIGTYAFNKDKKLKTLNLKSTTKLTKFGVKKSLKGSSVKTVKVKKSKVKSYKKYFKKSNSGRKVKVKK